MGELNPTQEAKLRNLCERYEVEFNPSHYFVNPPDSSMMPGWAEGWVGGIDKTIFVGVSPEGESIT